MAHIDAGKTTVTERILYYSGRIHKIGEVHDGEAVMDWMPQEKERGITITSAVTAFDWQGQEIHLIDTPGHVDFTIEVERSLRVLDGVIALFCAVGGVEPQSEAVWHQADRYGVPRIAFINKMDRVGADYFRTIKAMVDRLEARPLTVQIPLGEEERFQGVIDVVGMKALVWEDGASGIDYDETEIPIPYQVLTKEHRDAVVETVSELDDALMEKYVGGEEIGAEELKGAIRRVTLGLKAVPVLCGSGLKNKGIQPLLDAVVDYLPSPVDIPPIEGIEPATQRRVVRSCKRDDPFSALVFKVMNVEGRKLSYLRVYSGSHEAGGEMLNVSKGKVERSTRLFRMHANRRERITEMSAGDIVAALGLKLAMTGDSLSDPQHPVMLEQIDFYRPVMSVAVEPKRSTDQEKLYGALERLAEEDPTFQARFDEDSSQTILSGMGELHLEILVDRLSREFNLQVNVGRPQVVYRETISSVAEGEATFEKEIGGTQHFGHVRLQLEPVARGEGFQFLNGLKDNVIAGEFLSEIEESVREATLSGAVLGFPVVDIRVTVVGGSTHETLSSSLGYRIAASLAFRDACTGANPVLLEPIMELEVVVPEDFMGETIGDLSARGGRVHSVSSKGKTKIIKAQVALRKMFGYATALRSASQGRGTFSMQFSRYDLLQDKK
jgi:elongation factor G